MAKLTCVTIDRSLAFHSRRMFRTALGIRLPLRLVSELDEKGARHRSVYFVAYYDATGAMIGCEKVLFGAVVIAHRYDYFRNGALKRVDVSVMGCDEGFVCYDEAGVKLRQTHTPIYARG